MLYINEKPLKNQRKISINPKTAKNLHHLMTTLYLIRHGQKKSELGNPVLTDLGKAQAAQTGRFLRQFSISEVIASPFARTVETAELIAKELELEHTLHEALVERMNWDDPAVSYEQFVHEWIRSTKDREYQPKFGDSSRATGQRIEQLISSVLKPSQQIVLVSHGGAIVDYLRNVFGDDKLTQLLNEYPLGSDYQIHNCSVTKLHITDTEPVLELLNYTSHLDVVSE